jgi:dolichol-phosphate mannosyltransferase
MFEGNNVSIITDRLTGNLDFSADVGVLLATYREALNIERLIVEIESIPIESQILVIDDSSSDGTADIVRNLQEKYHNILLLVRPGKFGLGTAITDGIRIFLALKNPPKQVITMDADYSHDPQDIPMLLSTMKKGDGLVIGSRYCEGGRIVGWPFLRRVISRMANTLAISIARLKVGDCTSGFRCYSTEFLKTAINNLHSTTYEIQIETAKQAHLKGFGVKEVPVLFVNRKRGKSKLSASEIRFFFSYIFKIIRKK